ncbi:isocitrate lyase/PEP mutase family protein [Burkholderia cenocepacia]|uniref:isocitrate lyase/PEP mutase family protein n=1 Tax=Burkholderia cenocepacia TaxID=95486 RepID=UPI0009E1344A|nr:isocitrate lyase/phosphoenolpyruvate mutase family protein [Burkholderia cenocepacia]ARF86782.1 putative carboxyvinyl-carboxyphosphonate phosphorylmutase [Burkholderia cenocepacia]MCW3674609.1 isocitrate lyase/phosphoenolpyruvate mutase family protein [Burkholderia cenocepacia]MDC6082483.1 isocitrate lyase/phosphoenolpyruvate mutase family protein [Burkholderia cenocepacia]SPV02556.1 PEP phosphonomutase [Burkholderia cenocepacia]
MSIVDDFRKLHQQAIPLRLPNAWDAGSARLIESLGAQAVATTSAGFAWALGYPDGRVAPFDEVLASVRRMVRVLKVPLSVDIEHGYADDPQQVARHAVQLAELGVAGINIEDGPDAPALLAAKIEAIKRALASAGAELFVNARSDVYLADLAPRDRQAEEALARAAQYASAGADGIFLPALSRLDEIERIAAATPLPLNVMALPGLADAATLGKHGVRRLSAGSGIAQVMLGEARNLARDFLERGDSQVVEQAMPYGEIQALFA